MSILPLDSLLAPLSDAAPCGEDASASGVLFELETAIQGQPATQFRPVAEDPDWKELKSRTIEVAGTTKDVRVAGILAATLLRTDGLEGLRAAVQLVRGYLEQYWEGVFPLLDATENNDPSERVNALSNLAAPFGADGDLLRIIAGVRSTPMLVATQAGRFTLAHYLAAKGIVPWPADAGEAPTTALLEAAVQEVGAANADASAETARGILAELAAIEKLFKEKAGEQHFPSFVPLRQELKHVVDWLGAAPAEVAAIGDAADGGGAAAGAQPGAGPSISGQVRSREDVTRALNAIIAYYKESEPSSPVPFLLRRVQRVVNMNFIELISELTPEAMERIVSLTGPLGEETPPTSES